jgi:hypothetical protein
VKNVNKFKNGSRQKIEMDWEEAENMSGDRMMWQSCVAQCAAGTNMD